VWKQRLIVNHKTTEKERKMNHYVIKRFFACPCRKAAWTFVVLATLTTTACVDEDNAAGNGKKGVSDAVRFNVTDGQAEASAKRAAGLTRSIMPEPVAASVFETKVLPTDNPDYQVVQTTVEGVNPVTPTPGTRAVVAWTRGRFSSTGMNGTSQTAMTNQWFDSEPTQGDGTLDNLHRWTWQKPWGRFFAVYPEVTSSYSKIALSPAGHLPTPYVDFEVEANVQNMKDLMIARSNDAQYVSQGDAPATSLQFQHALTAVKFSVGDNLSLGTITKIEITGALSKGRYTMSDMPITQGTWTYPSTDRSQVNSLDGVSIAVSQTPNAAIAGTDGRNYTFYMLPQQLDGQNVKAMIYYTTPDNKKHKLTIRLKGQWEAGTTSEYKLSQSNSNWQYHFTVTDNNLTFEHTVQPADVQHYKVTSWRESGAVKQAVPWTVTKYEEYNPTTGQWTDMGPNSWPTWLLNFTYNGPGDANGAANVGNVNLYAVQMRNHLKEYNDALKNATPLVSLDITKLTELTELELSGAKDLTTIDLSKNTKLETLDIRGTKLASLDLSKHTAMKYTWVYENQLSTIKLSPSTLSLWGYGNRLTSLDVSMATGLYSIDARDNALTTLTLATDKTKYHELKLSGNGLTNLDLQNAAELKTLEIGKNANLAILNLRGCTKLQTLDISTCQRTTSRAIFFVISKVIHQQTKTLKVENFKATTITQESLCFGKMLVVRTKENWHIPHSSLKNIVDSYTETTTDVGDITIMINR